jgi:hypothetical protein
LRRARSPKNLSDLDSSAKNNQTLSLINEKSGKLDNHLSIGSLNSDDGDERWKKRSSSAIGEKDFIFN